MQHDRLHVVNAVPVKLLSDPYQSRYTMNAKQRQDLIGFNVNTDTSSKLLMPNQWACELICLEVNRVTSSKLSMPNYNGQDLTCMDVNRDSSSKLAMPNHVNLIHVFTCFAQKNIIVVKLIKILS